jgi:hypothetical protein
MNQDQIKHEYGSMVLSMGLGNAASHGKMMTNHEYVDLLYTMEFWSGSRRQACLHLPLQQLLILS